MFGWLIAFAIVSSAIAMGAAPLRAQDCYSKRPPLTEFGKRYNLDIRLSALQPQKSIPMGSPNARIRFVRFLIKPKEKSKPGWKLVMRDQHYRPIQVLSADNFPDHAEAIWTDRLPVPFAHASLVMDAGLESFYVDILSGDAMPEKAVDPLYSTKGDNPDWRDLYEESLSDISEDLRVQGEAVGMLTSFAGSSIEGISTWCCSGALISVKPRILFLTNFHCGERPGRQNSEFWTEQICRNTVVDFSWDGDPVGMEFSCKRVVKRDSGLDSAVLELVPLSRNRISANPIAIRTAPPAFGENLHIIHHPQCIRKKISQGCQVGERFANWEEPSRMTDFTHTCDTAGGSSGAPVIDKEGRLVGLHHLPYQFRDDGTCDRKNKAVGADLLKDLLADLPVRVE